MPEYDNLRTSLSEMEDQTHAAAITVGADSVYISHWDTHSIIIVCITFNCCNN